MKMTACLFMALMEAVRISETSVYINETARRYIPEGCHLLTPLLRSYISHLFSRLATLALKTETAYFPETFVIDLRNRMVPKPKTTPRHLFNFVLTKGKRARF
jgi:hypothetical protein